MRSLPFRDPAKGYTWYSFWGLQILDVYTTHRAMKYDCVIELNPLLPKRPSIQDMVILKMVVIVPAIQTTRSVRIITTEELLPGTLLTGAVVINNFNVLNKAQRVCNKL